VKGHDSRKAQSYKDSGNPPANPRMVDSVKIAKRYPAVSHLRITVIRFPPCVSLQTANITARMPVPPTSSAMAEIPTMSQVKGTRELSLASIAVNWLSRVKSFSFPWGLTYGNHAMPAMISPSATFIFDRSLTSLKNPVQVIHIKNPSHAVLTGI